MTRQGMEAAAEHGQKLPTFPDLGSAESALCHQRDELIRRLTEAALESTTFSADFRPESLKELEKWYFELYVSHSFGAIDMSCDDFERSMAMYFGEVLVRNEADFDWVVSEYAFEAGKYEIGVAKPLLSIMLRQFTDLHARTNNKRQQSIWRDYRQYAS
jgi:hypothetical protein